MPILSRIRGHVRAGLRYGRTVLWAGRCLWAVARMSWQTRGMLDDAERISGIQAQREVLDSMARSMGVEREPGETDQELRARVRREVTRLERG